MIPFHSQMVMCSTKKEGDTISLADGNVFDEERGCKESKNLISIYVDRLYSSIDRLYSSIDYIRRR